MIALDRPSNPGGGQHGRMLILAGRAMGYRFHIYELSGPARRPVADLEINASTRTVALKAFAEGVDVITLEFENIPAEVINSARSSQFSGNKPSTSARTVNAKRTSKRAASPASHSNMLILQKA